MRKFIPTLLAKFVVTAALTGSCYSVSADVLYIGDNTYSNVFSKLKKSQDIPVEYGLAVKSTVKSAGIWNYKDWLYSAKQTLDQHPLDALVISLGKKDLRLSLSSFPSAEELDFGISEILESVDSRVPVIWVLPHSFMPKSQLQKDQKQAVVDALMRAQNSKQWPNFQLISLDDWAFYHEVKMIDLLANNRTRFSKAGAKKVAGLVVLTINESLTDSVAQN